MAETTTPESTVLSGEDGGRSLAREGAENRESRHDQVPLPLIPKTLFDRIWESHVVHEGVGESALLYIDLHLLHEMTSPQAFAEFRLAARRVRRPDLSLATMDHNVPMDAAHGWVSLLDDHLWTFPKARAQVDAGEALGFVMHEQSSCSPTATMSTPS